MLRLTRTANAGVLLELDGSKILLDGVSREIYPYPATPDPIQTRLRQNWPDAVAITHRHEDHCHPEFEADYTCATGRQVLCPELGRCAVQVGAVNVQLFPTRHIGKMDCLHTSYLLTGSSCVWFTGDAAPAQWKSIPDLPAPDVLIATFAFATTPAAWRYVQSLCPRKVVLLHLPDRKTDPYDLWQAVEQTTAGSGAPELLIPELGQTLQL